MPLVLRAGADGDEGGSGEGASELAAVRFVFLSDCDGDSNGDGNGDGEGDGNRDSEGDGNGDRDDDGDGAKSAESPVVRRGGRRVLLKCSVSKCSSTLALFNGEL